MTQDEKRAYKKEWRIANRVKQREYNRRHRVRRNADPTRDRMERYKQSARNRLYRAMLAGEIIQKPCSVCGSMPTHGHHEDYRRALDVTWLCPACHMARHAELRQKKLTGADGS